MPDTHFKIVFEGQLRDGVSLETAKRNLAQLFKSEVSAIDRLFDGQPVALKRGLIHSEADRYLKALHDAGIDAHIEPDPAISLTLEEVPPSPYRTPVDPPEASPYAPPKAQVDTAALPSELKVFSIHGRIGRLRYLAWSLVLIAVGVLVASACAAIMSVSLVAGGLLSTVAVIALAVVSIQMGVQRLHDIGWSGWFLLLNLVPFLGSFFPFVMLLMPGNATANPYGAPPPPNTRAVKVLCGLWLVVIVLFILLTAFTGIAGMTKELQGTVDLYEQSLPYDDDSVPSDNARPAPGTFFKGERSL